MRILIVGLATFDQMAGGSARHLSGLAIGLRRLGYRVRVLTSATLVGAPGHTPAGVRGQLARALVRALVVIPGGALSVAVMRPDVVNIHFALDGLGAVVAARLIGIPVVVVFHGPWTQEAIAIGRYGGTPIGTSVRRAIEGFVYRRAARCIVLSRAFKDVLTSTYGVAADKVDVIPGGIDLAPFRRRTPQECRAEMRFPEQRTMVTLRRLVPRMGLDLAIEALASIPEAVRPHFVIGGRGPERERLERLAERSGVASSITFVGRVPDEQLATFYGAGDVCVVPSRELEGFGYVALESLAAGTPVVAAATGGLKDLVGGLEPRWLVPPDVDALAEKICDVLMSPESYPSRDDCREYASRYTWQEVATRTAEVFRNAAQQP